jgi:N-acetylglutamate synthase-like GNAT family acetyltransferase
VEDMIEIKLVKSEQEWNYYHRIKQKELFAPNNFSYNRYHPCFTQASHYHYLAFKQCKIIGILHLQAYNYATCIIRGIAIRGNLKNRGLGSQLLKLAEKEAKSLGCNKILLHAAPKAHKFYRRGRYIKMDFSWEKKYSGEHDRYGQNFRLMFDKS